MPKRASSPTPERRWPRVLAAATLALILLVTLAPFGRSGGGGMSFCLLCGDYGLADAIRNVVLFTPLGIALTAQGWRRRRVILFGAMLSTSVELAQVFVVPGRDGNPVDIVSNTLGTALGWAIVRSRGFWGDPPAARGARLTLAALAAAVGILIGSILLLQPAPPRSTYYGQWTPDFGTMEEYEGEVLEATIGGEAVPGRRLRDSDAVRELLRSRAPIEILAVAGPEPRRVAPLFSIADDRRRQILLLGIDEEDLVFRYRARAAAMRLDQPHLRVPDFFRGVEDGDTIAVAMRWTGEGYCAALNGRATCANSLPVARGWSMLSYNMGDIERSARFFDFVWLALLFLPAGYMAPGPKWLGAAGAFGVGAILAIAAGLPVIATPANYLAAVVGLATGKGFRWFRSRRREAL